MCTMIQEFEKYEKNYVYNAYNSFGNLLCCTDVLQKDTEKLWNGSMQLMAKYGRQRTSVINCL